MPHSGGVQTIDNRGVVNLMVISFVSAVTDRHTVASNVQPMDSAAMNYQVKTQFIGSEVDGSRCDTIPFVGVDLIDCGESGGVLPQTG
jgi:hypothetical protein